MTRRPTVCLRVPCPTLLRLFGRWLLPDGDHEIVGIDIAVGERVVAADDSVIKPTPLTRREPLPEVLSLLDEPEPALVARELTAYYWQRSGEVGLRSHDVWA